LDNWKASLRQSFAESNINEGLSTYIHLLFCESLCIFCGRRKRITKPNDAELPNKNALIKEWLLQPKQPEEQLFSMTI
jgi:oxygen-independent coproporphyrinogen-3 oxidase